MQDGGAVPFTSLFELVARTRAGDPLQIDRAFERTREIRRWFLDVKAAGGEGRQFYRAYYDNHPERGIQQSPSPGGLGLDREFLSDAALGTAFVPLAFLGLDAAQDGVLTIAPAVPSSLQRIGASGIFYRGRHLTIEAGHEGLSLVSDVPRDDGLFARIVFRTRPTDVVPFVDGRPARWRMLEGERWPCIRVPLKTARIEWRSPAGPVTRPVAPISEGAGPNR